MPETVVGQFVAEAALPVSRRLAIPPAWDGNYDGKLIHYPKKIPNRGNELKDLLKTQELTSLRGKKRTRFWAPNEPKEAKKQALDARFYGTAQGPRDMKAEAAASDVARIARPRHLGSGLQFPLACCSPGALCSL
jgi:hypothetical protein